MSKTIVVDLHQIFEINVEEELKCMEEYGEDISDPKNVFYQLDLVEYVLDALDISFNSKFSYKED